MVTRAIIVDDSRTVRTQVRSLLSRASDLEIDEIIEAHDGEQALRHFEKTPIDELPDIVILDRNMPILSGDACIKVLKSDPVWKNIPVIFLTAQAGKEEVVKGLSMLGCDDYLGKPFDAGEMLARVKSLIRAKKAEDANRELTQNLAVALVSQKKAFEELKTAKIQLAENEAIALMTRIFEKFVPKKFLERVAKDGIENIRAGNVQATRITTLFSDIRGFTSISEGMPPEELFSFLNEYLANMQIAIDSNGGFVDKFIGDAIMALFDQEENEQADSAVKAAIGMQRRLNEWNRERSGPPDGPILAGIGIHTGPVMMGTLGSETRIDSTVIGDAVNLASRLESLTKYYGVGIIVSGDTFDLLDHDVFESREIDFVAVKGKKQPMVIHEIYQHLDGDELALHRRLCEEFRSAMELFRSRSWKEAMDGFRACREISPDDKTSSLYIERCEYYAANPPADDWDGSFIMMNK